MSDSAVRFRLHIEESGGCIANFDSNGHEFALRHVWVVCVSAFDLYLTELVSEAGLRLIDRMPRVMPNNLRQIDVPLGNVLEMDRLNPAEKLVFFKDHIFASIQYKSFYRPDKVSEALSYIWTCPPKEKWARILAKMKVTGRYDGTTEEDVRGELTLIGDRRDLIAHSVDTPPGGSGRNPVTREDAMRVFTFVSDLGKAIDDETEAQLLV